MLRRRTSGGKKRPAQRSKAKPKAVYGRVPRTRMRASAAAENRRDMDAARKALADPERIPYEQVRRNLGL